MTPPRLKPTTTTTTLLLLLLFTGGFGILLALLIHPPPSTLPTTAGLLQQVILLSNPSTIIPRISTHLSRLTSFRTPLLPHPPSSMSSSPTPLTPIYFLSHGGPNTCHDTQHPVYRQLNRLGAEITQLNPTALVVFSAHWQSASGPGTIEVNTAARPQPLIYDFYGFPSHYYKATFPHRAAEPAVSGRVMELLAEGGIKAVGVERGLDHGVWVPFKVMFEGVGEERVPPIVQVSLFGEEDAGEHMRLGRAVARLREEGVVIVVSGMAVHNLREMFVNPKPLDYTVSFDEALREAVESEPGAERDGKMSGLVLRADARKAHPTLEHLLPIHVGVGAAGGDRGKRLWTLGEGSLSWAQFRFGEVGSK